MKRPVNSIWGRSSPCNLFPPSEGEKERRKSRRRNFDSVSDFFTGGQEQSNRETGERNSSLSPEEQKALSTSFFLSRETGKRLFRPRHRKRARIRIGEQALGISGRKKFLPAKRKWFFLRKRPGSAFFPALFFPVFLQAEPGAGAAHVHVKRRRKTQQEWTSFR